MSKVLKKKSALDVDNCFGNPYCVFIRQNEISFEKYFFWMKLVLSCNSCGVCLSTKFVYLCKKNLIEKIKWMNDSLMKQILNLNKVRFKIFNERKSHFSFDSRMTFSLRITNNHFHSFQELMKSHLRLSIYEGGNVYLILTWKMKWNALQG